MILIKMIDKKITISKKDKNEIENAKNSFDKSNTLGIVSSCSRRILASAFSSSVNLLISFAQSH